MSSSFPLSNRLQRVLATSTPLDRTSAVSPTYSSNHDHPTPNCDAHTSNHPNTIGSRLNVAAAVVMCQYRYYYYAGCRHQRTVLVKYCANATSKMVAPPPKRSDSGPPASKDTFEDDGAASAHDDMASASSQPALSTSDSLTLPPSSASSPDTPTDLHISHQQYTLASTPELTSDVTSLQTQHTIRRHTVTVIDDMATSAFPAFTRMNKWRQPHQQLITDAFKTEPGWVVVDQVQKENIVSH